MKIYLWSKKRDDWKLYDIKDFNDKKLKNRGIKIVGSIYIGNNVYIGNDVRIGRDVYIGDGVRIGHYSKIGDGSSIFVGGDRRCSIKTIMKIQGSFLGSARIGEPINTPAMIIPALKTWI
jgi:UDP-3-O-[3-hydroxymyristoyl] glucosamine N-acyltransferase